MARRLRSVKLDEISFVGKGDNPEAHVLLLKMKTEPNELSISKQPKDLKNDVQKTELLKTWFENTPIFKSDDVAVTFDELIQDRNLRDKIWDLVWTLEESLGSIVRDQNLSDKTGMIQQTIDQFKTAVTDITKGDSNMNEKLKKELEDKIAALEKQVADLTKEKEDVEKAADAKAKELEMKLEEAKAKGVKKEEGEDIYKGLPEAVVKEIESNRERIAKMEDDNLTREYVSKAAEVTLVGKADELGDMLKAVAKTDPTMADKILTVFKTAQARIKEGGLLGEVGKEDSSNAGATAYDKIVAKAAELRKATPALTEAQAFTKVYDSDSDLRTAYLKERNSK